MLVPIAHQVAAFRSNNASRSMGAVHLRSISKLYVQDACINKRDNELGLSSIQLPACADAQDGSSAVCQSVFKNGGFSITTGLREHTQVQI